MFTFLWSIGLRPLDFSEARKFTKKANPFIGDILQAAFEHAQAVVVLLTPDDEARLQAAFHTNSDAPYERVLTGQARLNVIFEAGMAFATHPDRTILVQIGDVRPFSDVAGRHMVYMDGSPAKRQELASRLEDAGCHVNLTASTLWHTAGDLSPSPTTELKLLSPSTISLLHGRNLHDGAEFSRILDYALRVIDVEAYGSIEHFKEVEVSLNDALEWIKINADIYTFLLEKQSREPIGYINAMPLDDSGYAAVRTGKLPDSRIHATALVPFIRNQPVKIYLMSIAISRKYRRWGQGLFQQSYLKLLDGFVEKLEHYASRDSIRVTHFLANVWTPEGHKMCQFFGMKEIGRDKYDKVLYELDISSAEAIDKVLTIRIGPNLKRLFDLYRNLKNGHN